MMFSKEFMAVAAVSMLVLCLIISQSMTVCTVVKVKQRKKQGLLPDYKQIELLRDNFSESIARRAFKTGISSEDIVLSQAKMDELKEFIAAKKDKDAWKIVDGMIADYKVRWFVTLCSIFVITILIMIVLR